MRQVLNLLVGRARSDTFTQDTVWNELKKDAGAALIGALCGCWLDGRFVRRERGPLVALAWVVIVEEPTLSRDPVLSPARTGPATSG